MAYVTWLPPGKYRGSRILCAYVTQPPSLVVFSCWSPLFYSYITNPLESQIPCRISASSCLNTAILFLHLTSPHPQVSNQTPSIIPDRPNAQRNQIRRRVVHLTARTPLDNPHATNFHREPLLHALALRSNSNHSALASSNGAELRLTACLFRCRHLDHV